MSQLILASGSEWRKILLGWLRVPFEVVESGFDEKAISISDPEELVAVLAHKKAEVVANFHPESLVVGADTVIALDGKDGTWEIIGKAKDEVHAREILIKLRGREHCVFTGVAVIDATTGEQRVEVEKTRVVFRDFSDQVLESYVASGGWLGKAGAYQILSIKDSLVQSIDGGVTNIIGLPLARTVGMFEEMGVQIDVSTDDVVWNEIGFKD